jgi:hypothetical protein
MVVRRRQRIRRVLHDPEARLPGYRVRGGRRLPVVMPSCPAVDCGPPGRSFALWSHRRMGVPGIPRSLQGESIDAAVGGKAVNSGWGIVQNKANLLWTP